MNIKQNFIKFNRYAADDQILPRILFMHYRIFVYFLLQLQTKLLFTHLQGDLPEGVDKYSISVQR